MTKGLLTFAGPQNAKNNDFFMYTKTRSDLKNFELYWPNHERQFFVVQKPNLLVFGLFEVFLNDKSVFGLVGQP